MSKRHSSNTNLTVISNGQYKGFNVYHRPLSAEYLDAILRTFDAALNEHHRTFMIRVDLHLPQLNFPDSPAIYDTSVIGKFFKSLNAKIQHDRYTKGSERNRVHPCTMRYVWARERAEAPTDHYHVAIFLNNDAYSHLGHFNRMGNNLRTKIVEAWASALGMDSYGVQHLVHLPASPTYYINRKTDEQDYNFSQAFERLSYLAKLETKHFGDRTRSFGCSQF
ncbi:inovirus Gp2 family protein [Shewanella mangrovisoli]|uniref:Inovirus Gp2 family protein n=1 Tax=Shewanella mangrovisoli TaxID=2864211 RepID=A0ABV4VDM4_9GAMM